MGASCGGQKFGVEARADRGNCAAYCALQDARIDRHSAHVRPCNSNLKLFSPPNRAREVWAVLNGLLFGGLGQIGASLRLWTRAFRACKKQFSNTALDQLRDFQNLAGAARQSTRTDARPVPLHKVGSINTPAGGDLATRRLEFFRIKIGLVRFGPF